MNERLNSGGNKIEKESKWLKDGIWEYVGNHHHADSVDVVSYFKLGADITLQALRELQEEGVIERYWDGRCYRLCLMNGKRLRLMNEKQK